METEWREVDLDVWDRAGEFEREILMKPGGGVRFVVSENFLARREKRSQRVNTKGENS